MNGCPLGLTAHRPQRVPQQRHHLQPLLSSPAAVAVVAGTSACLVRQARVSLEHAVSIITHRGGAQAPPSRGAAAAAG